MRPRSKSVGVNSAQQVNFDSDEDDSDIDLNLSYLDYDEDEDVPTGNSTTNHANSLWSPQNQMQLICEVRHQIPRKDTLPFDERVMKIKWTNINIGNYSPKELEDEFSNLVKRSRQFRILEEIIKDQELEIMPQLGLSKPVGPFILFMRDNKDKLARMNDTVSKVGSYTKLAAKLFQECGEKERNRYIAMSKDMMKKYKEGLSRYNFSNKGRPVKNERKPKRTKDNPTEFFVKSKALEDPSVSKANARKMYLELNRSKKLKWILRWLALKKGQKANMAEYSKCQSNLTKDELSIYDEYEGKPQIKSGYHIFLRDFIATLDSEDSAHNSPLKLAVQKWKTLSESKKAEYNKQSKMAKKAFTVSFSRYIASLPEDRQIHEINMLSSPKKEVKKRPVATVTKKAKNNTSMNVSNHEISERSDSELDDEDPPETIFQIDTSTKVALHSSLIDDEDGDEVVQKIYLPSPVIVAKRKRSLSPQFLNSRERKSPSPRKKPEKSKQLDISEYFQSPSTSKKNKKASSRDIEIAKSIEKFKAEKPPEDILAFYAQEENLSLKKAKKAFSSLTSLKKAAIDKKMKRAKEKYLKNVEKFTGSLSEAELSMVSKDFFSE